MSERVCIKMGCEQQAVATLTFDYADQMAALGPLSFMTDHSSHDLCLCHAQRVSVPTGWVLVRHDALLK